jgi:large subunit ribosomal protein L10
MPTPQKEAMVAALRENVDKAQSLYLTDFSGVSVKDMEQMRRKLREVEAEYKVIKNTLLKLALADTPYAEMGENLSGQTGIAIGYGDPAAPARVLHDMIKVLDRNKVKSIAYEQVVHDGEFLERLASLPSREVQLQILLGTMMAPISGMARVLNAIKEKMEADSGETAVAADTEATEETSVEDAVPDKEEAVADSEDTVTDKPEAKSADDATGDDSGSAEPVAAQEEAEPEKQEPAASENAAADADADAESKDEK